MNEMVAPFQARPRSKPATERRNPSRFGVAREALASWAIVQTAAERRELTRAVAESVVRTLGEERVGARPAR